MKGTLGKHWKVSEKGRVNMSKAKTGNNHPMFQKKHSKKTKEKISNSLKGRKRSEEVKKKIRISSFEYVKKICDINFPRIGHNETQILDKLEQEFEYKILRQYKCEGYFIDGYIEEINIAIEVDERPKTRDKDIEREKIIKKKLNCKFIRINDFD